MASKASRIRVDCATAWRHVVAFCLLSACSQSGEATNAGYENDTRSAELTAASTSPRRGNSTEELEPLPQEEVTPELARAAQELLEKHTGEPYGSEFALHHAGKRYVARIEQHYHEPGGPARPYGHHRGVTLYRPKP